MTTVKQICLGFALVCAALPGVFCQGQDSRSSSANADPKLLLTSSKPKPKVKAKDGYRGPFRSVGLAAHVSTEGIGGDIATPLSRHLNVRGTADFIGYVHTFKADGLNYAAALNFRSGQATLDWFPFWGFHISPGVLIASNTLTASLSATPGKSFLLGDIGYYSSPNDPVRGSATLVFPRMISPVLKIGFGNIIPRSNRHWSIPIEFGGAYIGHPTLPINLLGTACQNPNFTNCSNLATDPTAQQNIRDEQNNLNEDLKRASVYPLVSIGFGYKF